MLARGATARRVRFASPLVLGCLGFLVLAALVAPVQAAPVPAGITALYDDLRIALEMQDIGAITKRLSPMAILEWNLGSQWVQKVAAIVQEREGLKVELKLDDVKLSGDKALVLSTWAITGRTKATGEPWNTTLKEADLLDRRDGNWEITALDPLDPAGATKITDGVYQDPKAGLEATAPPQWSLLPLTGGRASVVAVSPDLAATVTWLVTDLPGTFTTEQIARANEDAVSKLLPSVGITSKDATFGAATLAGRPSFQAQRLYMAANSPAYLVQSNMCVVGSTLYAAGARVFPAQALAANRAGIEAAIASTKITEAPVAALPASAGQVEGAKYVNSTYGCEITAPEGWETKVEQGQFKLQVSMREPGGASAMSLGMVELPEGSITAEQAIQGDEAVSEKAFEQYQLVRQGATKLGPLSAYESVSQFNMGGEARKRWRVYLIDGNRLFFMFGDAAPADKWGALEPLFRKTFQSFGLTEAKG